MKKSAQQTETPKLKVVSLSEMFAGTGLEAIFKQAEAGSCSIAKVESKGQKAKSEQKIDPVKPFGISTVLLS